MSRAEELLRLVDLYSRRHAPLSGVVSRSRLRSWVGAQTDLEGMWEPFVEELVARGLWAPWDGTDLKGTRQQQPSTYRDAGNDARLFVSPRPPPIGLAMAALGTVGFVFFMITSPPGMATPAYGAFFSVVLAVSGLYHQLKNGRPELSVRLDGRLLHLQNEKQKRTLPLQDIEWVDVEWQGMRWIPPGKTHYEQNRFAVVASLRNGERVELVQHVVRDIALKVCRAIETAVEAPQPRVRIHTEADVEADAVEADAVDADAVDADAVEADAVEVPVDADAADAVVETDTRVDEDAFHEEDTVPTVIVDEAMYEGAE